ncbi:acyl-phosphate glycerol-3-phosphate acyltransferase [Hydrogenispora ethanolica]|jgi:glycerol-3-phosphate acyltransferase PlsY|uniref:Glycerol-3-phosphate acyltransferase n=1 Tax=Hydrogenispora ethanolica TaxID=1082276 RepID=A0A4R1RE94_HYDET|nr:glycerol-3-phosphate 1-O-acyltransferase PlsY [Hydrogenispora ethanolica]TCL64234.1 acyl-phosphate glycerol-3-phosphate acyltransferase [Hydrogenispora ethanolica]
MLWIKTVIVLAVAYFIGSITSGDIVARIKKVDLRSLGSGNIGATNTFRVLGSFYGAVVLAGDIVKGILAVLLGHYVLGSFHGFDMAILTGVFAVIGHNWPVHAGFKGGKGIATSAGVMIGLTPVSILAALPVWLAVFLLSGYVSLASIVAAIAYPVSVFLFYHDDPYKQFLALIIAVLAIYRHHSNIKRLLRGEEHRILYKHRGGDKS